MSSKFVISKSADSPEETEILTQPQHTKIASNIPMDTLHHDDSQDSDSVNLEVGDSCRASYRREESPASKLNSLALFEEDMRMRPKV